MKETSTQKQLSLPNKRNTTLDAVRLFMAFGVIMIHVPFDTKDSLLLSDYFFLPTCVPFFFITSLALFISGLDNGDAPGVLKKMWWRILIPYLAWTTTYVLSYYVKQLLIGTSHHLLLWKSIVFGDSAVQMYYIPQLVIMQLIALSLYIFASKKYKNKWLGAVILLVPVCFIFVANYTTGATSIPVFAIAINLLIGLYFSMQIKSIKTNWLYVGVGILLMAAAFYVKLHQQQMAEIQLIGMIPLAGLGMFLFAIGLPPNLNMPVWLHKITTTSFGVFLSHAFFLETMEFILKKMHINIFLNYPNRLGFTFAVFVVAIVFTLIIRQIPFTKQLLLGETSNNKK